MTRRVRHIPGEAGIWVLIAVDLAMFASLFLLYAYERRGAATLWSAELSETDRAVSLFNTMVLLTSGWFVAMGVASIRVARPARARVVLIGASSLGFVFIGTKMFEYANKINAGMLSLSSRFLNLYFSITGLHLFHVIVGTCVLLWMCARMSAVESSRDIRYLECGAVYWHMVDLLWIIIFPLVYLLEG